MVWLLRKEIVSFFSSFIGYLVIVIFLLINGLFLFVFPSQMNVFSTGYAGIDGMFFMAPWILLFLAAAISMRFFADEKKSGTIELLLTYPITDRDIILSKFFAGVSLLFISLLPTLLFVVVVYALGSPPGNIDMGSTIGAYIGLLLLGALYIAIGTWVATLTDNQIISFLLTAVVSIILFEGFNQLAQLSALSSYSQLLLNMGIQQHYESISRGVIDTRDIIYFLSVTAFFLYCATFHIKNKRL